MIKRQLLYLLATTAIALAIMVVTTAPMVESGKNNKDQLIDIGEVSNVALEKEGVLYTLNFAQQNHLSSYINESIRYVPTIEDKRKLPTSQKLHFYRIGKSDITLIIRADIADELLFTVGQSEESHLTQSQRGVAKLIANICR